MKKVLALWACLVPLALGREWMLGHAGLSSPTVAAWLGALALPMIPFLAKPTPLKHGWLGVQRAIAGALALLGIYGGIGYLGAPLSVALGLMDTVVLSHRDNNRSGRWLVSAAVLAFILQASWDLRRDPHDLLIGFGWAAVGIAGRVWNYLSWQAQAEREESHFWVLALPLGGSAITGLLWNRGGLPMPPTWIWLPALIVAGLGLLAFFVENKIVVSGGALNARLSEITVLPAIWMGHYLLSPIKPRLIELALSLTAGAIAVWTLQRRPERTGPTLAAP